MFYVGSFLKTQNVKSTDVVFICLRFMNSNFRNPFSPFSPLNRSTHLSPHHLQSLHRVAPRLCGSSRHSGRPGASCRRPPDLFLLLRLLPSSSSPILLHLQRGFSSSFLPLSVASFHRLSPAWPGPPTLQVTSGMSNLSEGKHRLIFKLEKQNRGVVYVNMIHTVNSATNNMFFYYECTSWVQINHA